jgi:hypothetical protein
MFVRNGFKLLFIHPPKTGGISIGSYILNNGFSYTQDHLTDDLKKEYMKYGNHHVDSRLIPNIDYNYVFSIFRDPIERLKSGYKHRFSEEFSFEEFVDKGLLEYNRNSSRMLDQIIKPQVEYYTKNCEVFLFENIKNLPIYLNEKNIKVYGNLEHINKSKKITIDIKKSLIGRIRDFYKEDYLFLKCLSCSNTNTIF